MSVSLLQFVHQTTIRFLCVPFGACVFTVTTTYQLFVWFLVGRVLASNMASLVLLKSERLKRADLADKRKENRLSGESIHFGLHLKSEVNSWARSRFSTGFWLLDLSTRGGENKPGGSSQALTSAGGDWSRTIKTRYGKRLT